MTAVFLARMVIPRSRSRSLESRMRLPAVEGSRKTFDCLSRPSTRVVLPWSTWATMAMLRRCAGSRVISVIVSLALADWRVAVTIVGPYESEVGSRVDAGLSGRGLPRPAALHTKWPVRHPHGPLCSMQYSRLELCQAL